MAHWPQWIDSDLVDSQAMLQAYHQYVTSRLSRGLPAPSCHGHLWQVKHYMKVVKFFGRVPAHLDSPYLQSRPCLEPFCERCESGRGGFQFRWPSPAWAAFYKQNKREGAWVTPELLPGQQWPDY